MPPSSPPPPPSEQEAQDTPLTLPPDQESALLTETTSTKASANKSFAQADYPSALLGYQKALATCPAYLEYDVAVLHANIAACHLKLAQWKDGVDAATLALEALDRVDPPPPAAAPAPFSDAQREAAQDAGEVAEVDSATEARIEALSRTGRTLQDVHKLRTKALLRRARARHEVGGWASLQGAQDDYTTLLKAPEQLSSLDREAVQRALRTLPAQLEQAKNAEMADMMGKLKTLGNGILKPFGLSTENFQFTKDEASGGYSMQFNQNGK
ncbi:hypothetical protein BS50DRAFT_483577 [Corynespora cassiicola Philippines]|uniref:Tetratricopeptide repeat protein 1 n=1 Tax=Corynespora cassiicola Philippines TaxID=1448308 RepID=A0A2T2P5F7_CORCC|nr:hypothetical protein BS50DRAFT_483577 [Corynespora cassiicola Philippines]